MRLGDREVNKDTKAFVIAELGINHNGSIDIAKELIVKAKECGADCVKFQKRTINRILTKAGLEMPYMNNNSFGATYGEHKEALEFSKDQMIELFEFSKEHNVIFTASGWDEESVDLLDEIGIPFFKMASADLTNFPLLKHTAKKGKPIILSTGMADMATVKNAYRLVHRYNHEIVLLQCTSSYPTPDSEINLNVIHEYHKQFPDALIGFSGHEKGIAISLAAVTLGAKVIERHFTLDRTMKGGDHAASLEPAGFAKLTRDIHIIQTALGTNNKEIQPSESACIKKLRKSVVSKVDIPENTVITKDMLTVKGPGTGISPEYIHKMIGLKTTKDIEADTVMNYGDINSALSSDSPTV